LGQSLHNLLHVVAHLPGGLQHRHRGAVVAQQQQGLVDLDDNLRLLAA